MFSWLLQEGAPKLDTRRNRPLGCRFLEFGFVGQGFLSPTGSSLLQGSEILLVFPCGPLIILLSNDIITPVLRGSSLAALWEGAPSGLLSERLPGGARVHRAP